MHSNRRSGLEDLAMASCTIVIAVCNIRRFGTPSVSRTQGVAASVGSTGDSCDKLLAESLDELFETEVIHRRDPCNSRTAVELATLEWADW